MLRFLLVFAEHVNSGLRRIQETVRRVFTRKSMLHLRSIYDFKPSFILDKYILGSNLANCWRFSNNTLILFYIQLFDIIPSAHKMTESH